MRILAASVPSSGFAISLNQGWLRACLAVMRCAGSYTKILERRSRKCLKKVLLVGMMSWEEVSHPHGLEMLRARLTRRCFIALTNRREPRNVEGWG